MNRRDLLKALTGIVPAATVKTLPAPKADDLIVVECTGYLDIDDCEIIARQVRECLAPRQRVLVLSGGTKLKVVSRADVRGVTKDV